MENIVQEITDEKIKNSDDITQLVEWRRDLKLLAGKLKLRMQVMQERYNFKKKGVQEMFMQTAQTRNIAISKMESINLRLRELRGTVGKPKAVNFSGYVKYLKAFVKITKKTVDENIFNEINNAAKEAVEWSEDMNKLMNQE